MSQMPSLFVGHGSPMNIVDQNEFTQAMRRLGDRFRPRALLVISAHWLDRGITIQNALSQRIIYDFGGFPKELYSVQYPARGWEPELLKKLEFLGIQGARLTDARGLDHGTWAVLLHLYPNADIPVVQMSIPEGLSLTKYYQIGLMLRDLRNEGVMILGSGNIVHNLRQINWDRDAPTKEWAVDFDKKIKDFIDSRKFEHVLSIDSDHKEIFELSHPTNEHFVPLAYVLGAASQSDEVEYPCAFFQNGSISMRSVIFF